MATNSDPEPRISWQKSSATFNRFKVLAMAYPNHTEIRNQLQTKEVIVLELSRAMDVEWFGNDPAMTQWAVTGGYTTEGHDDAFGFDFGLYDHDRDEFIASQPIIIRETAGGGFMLQAHEAIDPAHADRIKSMFYAITKG